ncbi:MAG: riboflavin biosynthesis protein RibF [Halobacteriovorax sp.]|nr:riboflavin biosynthesis protein RibF [Halobacteriovorax sp.]
MKILNHTKDIVEHDFGATIGNFDGVHLGHVAMLEQVREKCKSQNLKFVVITFFPHPAQILRAMRGFLVSGYEERRSLLKSLGVDYLIEIPFTRDFSATTATQFVEQYVQNVDRMKLLCLGYDFAFGAHKSGDYSTFDEMLKNSGIELVALKEFCGDKSEHISSSVIRELIRKGNVERISSFLGRHFSLKGKVVKGKGRGKGIGYPTANLQIAEELIAPSTGVYATKAVLRGKTYQSVTNIGFNPTFNDSLHMTIETHIFSSIDDFYDEEMTVIFLGKIREEKRFSGVDELKAQIAKDSEVAKAWSC